MSEQPETTDEPAEQTAVAEERAEVAEEHANVLEERAEVAEEHANVLEEQAEVAEEHANVLEEQAEVAEEQAAVAEEQAEVAEEQAAVAEEQVAVAQEQAEVADKPAKRRGKRTDLTKERTEVAAAAVPSPRRRKVVAEPLPGARAQARYSHVGPRKARRVVDLVRGMKAADALDVLRFTPQAASEDVYKVVASAMANAEHNEHLDRESLWISEAYVDEGPTLKRFRPRAQGRAYRVRKRTSHITVVVEAREQKPRTQRAGRGASTGNPAGTSSRRAR